MTVITEGSSLPDVDRLHRVDDDALAALGIDRARVHWDDVDELIRMYETTFQLVGPTEHPSRYSLSQDPQVQADRLKKIRAYRVRWAMPAHICRAIALKQRQGQHVQVYVDWLHDQLTRTFRIPWQPLVSHASSPLQRALARLLDLALQFLMPIPPIPLDDEVLGEFLRSMERFDTFQADTWKYVAEIHVSPQSDAYFLRWVLMGRVYARFHPRALRSYLQHMARRENEEGVNLANIAQSILAEKKLKLIHPPYSVGIAVDE